MELNTNEIIPYANNQKQHPQQQVDKIAASIAKFGFNQPIVIDKNKVIIAGHGRYQAALKLGLQTVPVKQVDLDEHQAMAYRIADNKTNESDWDEEMLKIDLSSLELANFDLSLTGFDNDELDKYLPKESAEVISSGDKFSLEKEVKECPHCGGPL